MNENHSENQSPEHPPADTTALTNNQAQLVDPTSVQQPVHSKVDPQNLRPKIGPIVWGVLVLAFCAYTASQVVAPGNVDGTTFVIAATISLGVLLLVIGAAVIIRGAKAPRR